MNLNRFAILPIFGLMKADVIWQLWLTYFLVRLSGIYHMNLRMTVDLVINALSKALKNQNHPAGIIVYDDQGSQYTANEYRQLSTVI